MVAAYIYCRVSSTEQANQINGHISLQTQALKCSAYAEQQGWSVKKVVSEVCSARRMTRLVKLAELIEEIKETESPAMLLISNVSRFSRNTMEALAMVQDLEKHKITLVFIQEQINMATSSGRHTFRILLSNAEYESDQIGDRVKAAFSVKKSLGNSLGNPAYGYQATVIDGIRKFIPNEYEQNVISFIVEAVLCEKTDQELTQLMSLIKKTEDNDPICFYNSKGEQVESVQVGNLDYANVAELLNAHGVTKRGKAWKKTMVSTVFRKHRRAPRKRPTVATAMDTNATPVYKRKMDTNTNTNTNTNSNGSGSGKRQRAKTEPKPTTARALNRMRTARMGSMLQSIKKMNLRK